MTKENLTPPDINQFLDDMLIEAGFDKEKSNFELLRSQLETAMTDTIMTQLFALLTEEQREKISQLVDSNSGDKVQEYLLSSLPDYENILGDIIRRFRDDYIANMKSK